MSKTIQEKIDFHKELLKRNKAAVKHNKADLAEAEAEKQRLIEAGVWEEEKAYFKPIKREGKKKSYTTATIYYDIDDPASIFKSVGKLLAKQEGLSDEAAKRVAKAQVAIVEWRKHVGELD